MADKLFRQDSNEIFRQSQCQKRKAHFLMYDNAK